MMAIMMTMGMTMMKTTVVMMMAKVMPIMKTTVVMVVMTITMC